MIGDATTAVETTVRKVQRAIRELAGNYPFKGGRLSGCDRPDASATAFGGRDAE